MHLFLLKGLLNEPSATEQFSKEYIVVDVQLVKNYVCYLQNLQLKKKKHEESRKKLQKEEKCKTYDDYNRVVIYREGQLKKLKVSTLDLYLDKHNLNCSRSTLKKDKVDIVTADIARYLLNEVLEKEDDEASEDEQEFEDDVVLEEIGDNSDDEEEATDAEELTETDDSKSDDNDCDSDNHENFDKDEDIADDDKDNSDSGDLEISDILCTTKSGRTCRTWRGRYLY